MVLQKPVVSEKSASVIEAGKYSFYVDRDANKIQVRKYIEQTYGVEVEGVNVMNVKGKKRRRGRITGEAPDRKKAIITLKPGQSLDKVKGIF